MKTLVMKTLDARMNLDLDFARFDRVRALSADADSLTLLDQRALPGSVSYLRMHASMEVAEAIRNLTVRGAPAIGIAGAYGAWLAALEVSGAAWREPLQASLALLREARPTAINLAWAIDQQSQLVRAADSLEHARSDLRALADRLLRDDLAANHRMGLLGAACIEAGSGVLTHCNTGSLATAGFGTALGVIRAAFAQGRLSQIYASETRPWLQGARLTAWELLQDEIPASLVADGAGGLLFSQGKAQWLIVGADRICANGDSANKIGTLSHACAARTFGAKVMVVAPWSTVDLACPTGAEIHIEERSGDELTRYAGTQVSAHGVKAFNPVFDVTPGHLIDLIVTERGVLKPPFAQTLAALA